MTSWPALGDAWRTWLWSRLVHSLWSLPVRLPGMFSARFGSIRPREYVAGSAVCLLLLAAIPDLRQMWREAFPPPPPVPPVSVSWSTGELLTNGLWRLTREITIREKCGIVVWRRWFRIVGREDVEMAALSSSTGSLSAVAVGGRSEPGTYEDWWEYRPIPGAKGVRIVTATVAQCPSGYEGVVDVYVTPFDWSGIQAHPEVSR